LNEASVSALLSINLDAATGDLLPFCARHRLLFYANFGGFFVIFSRSRGAAALVGEGPSMGK
jgi:hypothetical protein